MSICITLSRRSGGDAMMRPLYRLYHFSMASNAPDSSPIGYSGDEGPWCEAFSSLRDCNGMGNVDCDMTTTYI